MELIRNRTAKRISVEDDLVFDSKDILCDRPKMLRELSSFF